jgi:hypothetical protein
MYLGATANYYIRMRSKQTRQISAIAKEDGK